MNPRTVVLTAIAPALWATTYVVTTELLPPGRPLLAAALRASPGGLVLGAVVASIVAVQRPARRSGTADAGTDVPAGAAVWLPTGHPRVANP